MSQKYVYLFKEGNANMRELLGGKGANLAEMTKIGLPVPPGFTITTKACNDYYENNKTTKQQTYKLIFTPSTKARLWAMLPQSMP